MGWKKLAIISLIILLSIDAMLTSEYSNTKPTCSFKRISCLNETSFKFCFSTGSITYLYGEIKNCPQGTICSEYEGINACIEYRNELVNTHEDYPLEDTTYSAISSEHTIALPPVTITEMQSTETNRMTLPSTQNFMIQSTYSFDIPETNNALVDDVQSNQSKYDSSTDQLLQETIKSITSHMTETTSEKISHQTNKTQDILSTEPFITPASSTTHVYSSKVTKQKRKPTRPTLKYSSTVQKRKRKSTTPSTTYDYSSKITKRKNNSTTPSTISRTTPDHSSKITKRKKNPTTPSTIPKTTPDHSSKVTKRRRKSTTPSTTHDYSSKITKRKKKPTFPSTGQYSSKVTKRRRKVTSSASVQTHSSKLTKRRRKSTFPSITKIPNFPTKVTKPLTKSTTPSSITHEYSIKVTKRWKSTNKPHDTLKKRKRKPISSTDTSNFSEVTQPSETISFSYKATSTEYKMETPTVLNTSTSENPVTEDKSIFFKNHEVSTTSPYISTSYAIGNKSTSLGYTTSIEQSAVSTKFPCQEYLQKILKNISPVTVQAVNSIGPVENLKQAEEEEFTPPSACTSSGKYPSKNCNEYYECLKVMWWYRLMYRKCHRRERFDSGSLQCVPDISCN